MKLKDVFKDVDVLEWHVDPEIEIRGVSCDSRKTEKGDLFVAVCGFESDGHRFLSAAVEKGAVCVLVERSPEIDIPYVRMDNTRKGLALAAANFLERPAEHLKIVGVTGTSGKTTTTNLIREIIEKTTGESCGLIGTNVNIIGEEVREATRTTPESLEVQTLLREMVDAGCRYVVMEVSSHALFLDRVCGINFDAAVFTNLSLDHLDFHKTMDAYAEAKSRIFQQAKRGAVNLDDSYAGVMLEHATCPIMTFSTYKNDADIVAKDIRLGTDGVRFVAMCGDELHQVRLGIPGQFSVYNAMAAIAAVKLLDIPLNEAIEALAQCHGVKGRAEIIPTGRDFTVVIDYAHKPDALEKILTTLRECSDGRIVTLFGCGGDRDRKKRPLMGEIASRLSDFVIVTSDNPRTEEPSAIIDEILPGVQNGKTPYRVIENRREAIEWALKNAKSGDVILLAGKGHETYQEIGKQKFHLDEREVIAETLAQM